MRQRTSFGRHGSTVTLSVATPEKTSIVGTVLLAAGAVILAGGSFLLVSALMKPAPVADTGPMPALVELAMLGNPEDRVWTEADTAECKAAVNRQADADDALEHRMWSNGRVAVPSMAKGYSQNSARMVCEMVNKPLRLCDDGARKAFVKSLNQYADRTGGFMRTFEITANLVLPALAVVALPAPSEPTKGFGADLSREAMATLANEGFGKVAAAMAPVLEAGLISAADFGFMGAGIHPLIADMLGATPVRGNACAV